jgi:hypothetical protein
MFSFLSEAVALNVILLSHRGSHALVSLPDNCPADSAQSLDATSLITVFIAIFIPAVRTIVINYCGLRAASKVAHSLYNGLLYMSLTCTFAAGLHVVNTTCKPRPIKGCPCTQVPIPS